ncbi:MAG: hypothetical protein GKB99_04400 [Methanocellales archaeon]|nr:hypothetical protein [Methanocellales archaeon]
MVFVPMDFLRGFGWDENTRINVKIKGRKKLEIKIGVKTLYDMLDNII